MNSIFTIVQNTFRLSYCKTCKNKIVEECTENAFAATMMHGFMESGITMNKPAVIYRVDHFTGYLSIYDLTNQSAHIWGPFLLVKLEDVSQTNYIAKFHIKYNSRKAFIQYLESLPVYDEAEIIQIVQYLFEVINNCTVSDDKIVLVDCNAQITQTIRLQFQNLSNEMKSLSMENIKSIQDTERIFCSLVRDGCPKQLMHTMKTRKMLMWGGLCPSAIINCRNTAIQIVTLASRAAIAGGLTYGITLHLVNIYLLRLEKLDEIDEIYSLISFVLIDLATRVQNVKIPQEIPPIIRCAIDYVQENIYKTVTVKEIAATLHINETYLSKIFPRYTGKTLSNYILSEKIAEAKRLLSNTDLPLAAISNRLSFSSQAHFQKCFKKVTELTPRQYRLSFSTVNSL